MEVEEAAPEEVEEMSIRPASNRQIVASVLRTLRVRRARFEEEREHLTSILRQLGTALFSARRCKEGREC